MHTRPRAPNPTPVSKLATLPGTTISRKAGASAQRPASETGKVGSSQAVVWPGLKQAQAKE